ncbi:hypothetical protein [Promicromonospora sp. NPDC023987]|uniref:hypothetical protein n=1 Tax=Promicromonospora sp. NPDC023987 TaxID=3155360 RepID=UPI0033D4139B
MDQKTDNGWWYYYSQSSLEAADRARVTDVLADEYAPADLAVAHDSTPTYSGTDETHLILIESAVPGGN